MFIIEFTLPPLTDAFVRSFADQCAERLRRFVASEADPAVGIEEKVRNRAMYIQNIGVGRCVYGEIASLGKCVTVDRHGRYEGPSKWTPGDDTDLPCCAVRVELKTVESGTITIHDGEPVPFRGLDCVWNALDQAWKEPFASF